MACLWTRLRTLSLGDISACMPRDVAHQEPFGLTSDRGRLFYVKALLVQKGCSLFGLFLAAGILGMLAGAVAAGRRGVEGRPINDGGRYATVVLAISLLTATIFLGVIEIKHLRYGVPLATPIVLITITGILSFPWRAVRACLLAALVAFTAPMQWVWLEPGPETELSQRLIGDDFLHTINDRYQMEELRRVFDTIFTDAREHIPPDDVETFRIYFTREAVLLKSNFYPYGEFSILANSIYPVSSALVKEFDPLALPCETMVKAHYIVDAPRDERKVQREIEGQAHAQERPPGPGLCDAFTLVHVLETTGEDRPIGAPAELKIYRRTVRVSREGVNS